MIIFDTETNGLVRSVDSPERVQPKIIEFYGLKVDDRDPRLKLDELHLMIDPGEPLSEEIVRITSITDEMLKNVGGFTSHVPALWDFFLGERVVCGHNLTFDLDMLEVELRRYGLMRKFPWPPVHTCTVEITEHLLGRRLKLVDLHRHLFGEGFSGAHRAKEDVEATWRCYCELFRRGEVTPF